MRMPREFYIPKGATKVADRDSTAVAYVYHNGKGPCAIMFAGKRTKPDYRHRFQSEQRRETFVTEFFAAIRADTARKAEYRAERNSADRGLSVGDIVNTCWGYDQTNREFYQVTALIGRTMVEVREIAQTREETTWGAWRAGAKKDQFVGDPIRCVAKNGACKPWHYSASKWDGGAVHASDYA